MDSQYFLMFDRCLKLSFGRIALFLLIDEFLNLGGIQAGWSATTIVLNVSSLNYSFDSGLDVAIC